eukprot:362907-Chlamydomonas_euryale.AAC.11
MQLPSPRVPSSARRALVNDGSSRTCQRPLVMHLPTTARHHLPKNARRVLALQPCNTCSCIHMLVLSLCMRVFFSVHNDAVSSISVHTLISSAPSG